MKSKTSKIAKTSKVPKNANMKQKKKIHDKAVAHKVHKAVAHKKHKVAAHKVFAKTHTIAAHKTIVKNHVSMDAKRKMHSSKDKCIFGRIACFFKSMFCSKCDGMKKR